MYAGDLWVGEKRREVGPGQRCKAGRGRAGKSIGQSVEELSRPHAHDSWPSPPDINSALGAGD